MMVGLIRSSLDGKERKVLADTGGRPLGLARHPNGLLVIADGVKGLLSDAQGQVDGLEPKRPMGWRSVSPDDGDDESALRLFQRCFQPLGLRHDGEAIIEHGGDGRLLAL